MGTHKIGVNYDNIFPPIVKPISIRVVLALVANGDMHLK